MTILEKDMLEVVLIKGTPAVNSVTYIPARPGYFATVEVEKETLTQPTFGQATSVGVPGSELKKLWRMASFTETSDWIVGIGKSTKIRERCGIAKRIMEVFWKTRYLYTRVPSPVPSNATADPFLGLAPITYNAGVDTVTFCMIQQSGLLPTGIVNPFYKDFEFDIDDIYDCFLGPEFLPVLTVK